MAAGDGTVLSLSLTSLSFLLLAAVSLPFTLRSHFSFPIFFYFLSAFLSISLASLAGKDRAREWKGAEREKDYEWKREEKVNERERGRKGRDVYWKKKRESEIKAAPRIARFVFLTSRSLIASLPLSLSLASPFLFYFVSFLLPPQGNSGRKQEIEEARQGKRKRK